MRRGKPHQARLLGKIQGYLEAFVDVGPESEDAKRLAERLLEMIAAEEIEYYDIFDDEFLDELDEYSDYDDEDDDDDDLSGDVPF